jgi:hypothetical protein
MGARATRGELAERFQVSRQRIDELVNGGRLTEHNATIDVEEAEKLWASFDPSYVQRDRAGKERRNGAGAGPEPNPLNEAFNRAKTAEQVTKARMAELKFKVESGAYVPRDLVRAEALAAAKAFAAAADTFPRRVAPMVAHLKDHAEIATVLEREIRAMLTEIRHALDGVG